MKTNLIPLLVLLVIGACNKSSPGTTSPSGSIVQTGSPNYPKTVTTIQYDTVSGNETDSTITRLGYDAQHRITSNLTSQYAFISSVLMQDTAQMIYLPDTINVTERVWYNSIFSSGQVTAYRLDPVSHLAANSLTTGIAGNNPPSAYSDSESFQYDANGYLLVAKQFSLVGNKYLSNSSQYYTISNGNTVAILDSFYLSPGNIPDAYSVGLTLGYSGQSNPVMNMTGNGNNWDDLDPTISTSLIGHANNNQCISEGVAGTTEIVNLSYTLDGQGRTSMRTAVSGTGKLYLVTRYLYY